MEENEEWRPVVGYEQWYEVSNLGRVRRVKCQYYSKRKLDVLKPGGGKQYPLVCLYANRTRKICLVHHLVMAAFVGPRPKGYEINHKDGNKKNSRLSNLEYVTPSQNRIHALATGLSAPIAIRGEQNKQAKLKEPDVRVIRRLQGQVSGCELGKWFGVTKRVIYLIWQREAWTHVA